MLFLNSLHLPHVKWIDIDLGFPCSFGGKHLPGTTGRVAITPVSEYCKKRICLLKATNKRINLININSIISFENCF